MRIQRWMILLALCVSLPEGARGQTNPPANSDDQAAIRQTTLDYIEGWYSGDGQRMERALHPELAKRMVSTDSKTGKSSLNQKRSRFWMLMKTRPASRFMQRHGSTICTREME